MRLTHTHGRYAVLFLTTAAMWTTWLPMARTLSGQGTYAWANLWFNNPYRGEGLTGDYLFLIQQAVLGVAVLWLGFRNPRAPFHALLLFWHALPFANSLYMPLVLGQRNVFIGDTAGIRVDLTLVSPILNGLLLLAALAWVVADLRRPRTITDPRWTRKNAIFALLFAAYAVLTVLLEWQGPTHGATDAIAVPLNILAPWLIALALFPWKPGQGTPT